MRHIEENMQIACVRWFSYQYPKLAPWLHHSPNGGKRNPREAARFKAMGTKPGFPDLILIHGSKGFSGLCIEFKTATGKQTQEQKRWEVHMHGERFSYRICRSVEEFIKEVREYLE